MTDDDEEITPALVRRLIAEQFPQWSALPVRPVERQGWDNRPFRLGDRLSVRLPSADGYVPGLVREAQTLAALEPSVSFALPRVVASGAPSVTFGRPWSVREWIEGRPFRDVPAASRAAAVGALGAALAELQACPAEAGPWAGPTSAYRGCHISVMAQDVQERLRILDPGRARACERVWERAVATVWRGPAVWVHGDVAPGNVLFDDAGRLTALIDVGQTCVGDPSCDLAFAWLSCDADERRSLQERLLLPEDAWLRGAAWAMWKALITSAVQVPALYGRERDEVLEDVAELSMP
ncbi:phosphotransferase [Microcella daejeonensis]|uniref:phosphotransferase n=1 Tax=Microcella daejeonensis TaxID=2994971 RepID=UPI0022711632|nr:phosphotransferase [Microcella daejeonensis]WAB84604.1 phosphotransferase [Microcella daejeonensis]